MAGKKAGPVVIKTMESQKNEKKQQTNSSNNMLLSAVEKQIRQENDKSSYLYKI